jgi:Lon protease-like protein
MSEARRRADDGHLERALAELPLFPLPETVFFPHTLLPLHVFELRYRQLTEFVLAEHQHMAVVKVDETRVDCAVPGVARVAGIGRVVHQERLPDGRFHILLQGIARAELMAELPADGCLYRRALARLHVSPQTSSPDTGGEDDPDTLREVQTLRSCYARLLEVCPDTKDVLGELPLKVHEPRVLADVVCAAILEDSVARQAALEESCVARRLKLANDALATLLLQSIGTEPARMH